MIYLLYIKPIRVRVTIFEYSRDMVILLTLGIFPLWNVLDGARSLNLLEISTIRHEPSMIVESRLLPKFLDSFIT